MVAIFRADIKLYAPIVTVLYKVSQYKTHKLAG